MKQKKHSYLIILFTIISINVLGPKHHKDSSTVIIFNSGSSGNKIYSQQNHSIKISPLSFITGKIPLTFEKRITDFLSLQVGAGLTSRNYIRTSINNDITFGEDESWIKEGASTLPPEVTDISDNLFNFNHRKAALGYMMSIQPRVYFDSEALEGMFMGLSYDMYRYNFNIPGITQDNRSHTGSLKKEHESIKDFNVLFGMQYLYDKISLEIFTGIGLRNVKGEKYAAGIDKNDILYEGITKYTQKGINCSLGLKVGYLF